MSRFIFKTAVGFLALAFLTACGGGEDKNKLLNLVMPLKCDHANYREFIHNKEKTEQLISQTGKGCQLQGFDFRKEKDIDLRKAYLPKANLRNSDWRMIDAQGVILTDSDMQKSKIQSAKFIKADVCGADFTNADWKTPSFLAGWLSKPDFTDAKYNSKTTKFPRGFDPKKEGLIKNCSDLKTP